MRRIKTTDGNSSTDDGRLTYKRDSAYGGRKPQRMVGSLGELTTTNAAPASDSTRLVFRRVKTTDGSSDSKFAHNVNFLCSNFSHMLRIVLEDTYAKRDSQCRFAIGLFLEKLACGTALPFCWIRMASRGYR
jgi:hypothetical protein